MKPLLVTLVLVALRVTAGTLAVVMPTPPVASMVILPLVEVLSGVLVVVEISVSARAESTADNGHSRRQQGSRSGGKHQTVLDQLSLLKMSPGGGAASFGIV